MPRNVWLVWKPKVYSSHEHHHQKAQMFNLSSLKIYMRNMGSEKGISMAHKTISKKFWEQTRGITRQKERMPNTHKKTNNLSKLQTLKYKWKKGPWPMYFPKAEIRRGTNLESEFLLYLMDDDSKTIQLVQINGETALLLCPKLWQQPGPNADTWATTGRATEPPLDFVWLRRNLVTAVYSKPQTAAHCSIT